MDRAAGIVSIIMAVSFCVAGCKGRSQERGQVNVPPSETPATKLAKRYPGFEPDRACLLKNRENLRKDEPEIGASSEEACYAARNMFDTIDFTGMTPAEVQDILGEPTDRVYSAATQPEWMLLRYFFHNGWGHGTIYHLRVQDARVNEMFKIRL